MREIGEPAPSGFAPVGAALRGVIGVYRLDIGPRSVRRCPFHVSCSALALEAIDAYGAPGALIFIDRFFFRENMSASALYARVREEDGTLRLDDGTDP